MGKTYVGVNGTPRKVKKIYVGIPTVAITGDNLSDFFTISNEAYHFAWSSDKFSNNNQTRAYTTATSIWTAKSDVEISFDYIWGSEASYDKFTLTVAGTTIANAVSGSGTVQHYSGVIKAGQTLVMTYEKDGSRDDNGDTCSLYNILISSNSPSATEVARRIIKGYIGVNGVARQFL